MTRIFLDHAATTPVVPEARAAVSRGFDAWANPSSPHEEGRKARALLEEARATIAEPPIMPNPFSAPHFADAKTQAAFW